MAALFYWNKTMSVDLSPIGGAAAQFFDSNGVPLSGGKLYTYDAGTTTPKASYTTAAGTTAHSNPIILDASGRVPSGGEIWLTTGQGYKFVLDSSTDVLVGTWDNIYGYTTGSADANTEVQTATAGQTLFVLTTMAYTPGSNTLGVYIDGVNQVVNNSYVETNATSVTFVSGLHEGAIVKFINLNIASTDASVVTYEPGFTGSIATTVAAKLQETVSVKDFGAVSDGDTGTGTGTDNTAIFQTAIDYLVSLGGGTLYVPAGVYYLATHISMPLSIHVEIIGDGRDVTTFMCSSDCFRWVNTSATVYQPLNPVFRGFTVFGVGDTNKFAFKIDQRVNLTKIDIRNVKTYVYIGFLTVASGGYITGMVVDAGDFSYPFTGSSGYLIDIPITVPLNSIHFSSCWFSAGAAGAIRMLFATGYCKFQSCVFESNYGQYAVELNNPQVHFDSCIFTNNGRSLTTPIDYGAHIRLGTGGQQFALITNCYFAFPDPTATNFMAISKFSGGGLSTGVTVDNCLFAFAANYQKALVLDTEATPDGSIFTNNRFTNNTSGDAITGRDVRRLNNANDTVKGVYPKNIISSKTTTDTATYQIWGGSSFGPFFNYPANNSTALYEAKVTARNVDGTIYYSNIIRSLVDFKTGGTGYTATILGTMNETPIESSAWAAVSFAFTGNGTTSAGIALNVRCTTAATQIEWFAEVSISAATYG